MSTQDILNIVLVIFLLTVTGIVVVVAFYFIKALKAITTLADSLENTTQSIRDRLQLKALTMLPPLLVGIISRIFKRGR